MTKNQIEYLKLRETQRANLSQEELTRKRDENAHALGLGNLAELGRHNLETERQAVANLSEVNRHNVETERQAVAVLGEQQRHNRALEQVEYGKLSETMRANREREQFNLKQLSETTRANLARELLTSQQLAETYRSNVARETETHRTNVAGEQERKRSNLAQEQQKRDELEQKYVSLETDARIRQSQISLGYAQLGEDRRSNLAREAETRRSNIAREVETSRSNRAQEIMRNKERMEQVRANRASEKIRSEANTISRQYNQGRLSLGKYEAETARLRQQADQLYQTHQISHIEYQDLLDTFTTSASVLKDLGSAAKTLVPLVIGG